MTTWLIDPALFKFLATPKSTRLQKWFDANEPSLFLSAASLAEITVGVEKASRHAQRGQAMRNWFDDLATHFADRICPVDAETSALAGRLVVKVKSGLPRHFLHDALLVATAQIHGHGLVTCRDGVFGPWTGVPLEIVQ